MKLITWNVNGLRAVQKRNFAQWFAAQAADVVCLQEIKCFREQIENLTELHKPLDYGSHWHSAKKPGYSGLVIYARKDPTSVKTGLGIDEFDSEGRWLEAEFERKAFAKGAKGKITVINSYFPNSQRDHKRLPFKIKFLKAATTRLEELRAEGKQVLLCGDLNIAHKDIDLKNPKTNRDNAGFLPEERAWLDEMVDRRGWLDTFREFNKEPGNYTWWSYRPGVREKNVGWRLDYWLASPEMKTQLAGAAIQADVLGSDHCPVELTLRV